MRWPVPPRSARHADRRHADCRRPAHPGGGADRRRPCARAAVEAVESRVLLSTAVAPAAETLPIAQVNPGFTMGDMHADLARNLVYLLDNTNRKILAVDTDLGRTTAHAPIPGTGAGTGVAVSVDGRELYVSSLSANSVHVYSLPDLSPLRTLSVPTPGLLAAGVGDKLYVAGGGQHTAARQVDARTGEILAEFGRYYSALPRTNPAGTRLFVSELGLSTTGTDEYDVSNLTGGPVKVKGHATNMANGRDLAVDEQYNRLYSMSGGVYGVYALDMNTNTGTLWRFAGNAPYGTSVAVHPDLPHVWGGSQSSSGGITRYDRATGAINGSYMPIGTYKSVWDLAVTPNGNVVYKSEPGSTSVYHLGIVGKSSLVVTGVPSARFTTSQQATSPGLKVSFDGTGSRDYEANGTIVGYAWDFGDGTAAGSGATVDHTYARPGTYTVKLTVTDNAGLTDDYVAVVKVSDPPVAEPVSVTTDEDTAAPVTLRATDANGDALTYVIVTPPAHGTVAPAAGGGAAAFVYTPAADYAGPDSFTYRANDGRVDGNVATVSVTVNPVNDAPRAARDVLPLAGGGATRVSPLANDSDVEGDAFTLTGFTQPARGTVTRDGDDFLYTASAPFQGFDTFTYTVRDARGATATGEVSVASAVAVLDGEWHSYGGSAARTGYFRGFLGAAEPIDGWSLPAGFTNGRPVTIGGGRVFASDDNNSSSQTLYGLDPANGQTVWSLPLSGSSVLGQASYFGGRVFAQNGNHSATTVVAADAATGAVAWRAPQPLQWGRYFPPAVTDNSIWVPGGYYGGMHGYRHNGSQITFIQLPQEDNFGVSILGDAVYSFVASRLQKYSLSGSQQWSHAVNGGSGTVPVLADDTAYLNGGSYLRAVNLTTGAARWDANGPFAGSPAVGGGSVFALSGSTVKSFRQSDGAAGRAYQAPAGQTLTGQPIVTDDAVFAASDANTFIFNKATGALMHTLPHGGALSLANNRLYVVKSDGSVRTYAFARADNNWPVAGPDAATTAEETAVNVTVLPNDTDADGDTVRLRGVSAPAHGTAAINNDGTIRYQPARDFFGQDTFTYTVVDEKGGRATGTVTVTVTPVNDPPAAAAQTVYVPTAASSEITLAGTDPDGDALTFVTADAPLNGTLAGPPVGGKVVYTPKPGFTGSDNFSYRVSDGTTLSAPAYVTVFVDDAPVAADVTGTAREDQPATIALQGSDPNGDTIIFSVVRGPSNGSATINGRYLTYTPARDFSGTDTIVYRVHDGIMYGNEATLTITVVDGNDLPVARRDGFAAAPGEPVVTPDLLANDTDVDGDALVVESFTQPTHGTLERFGGGRLRYTPAAGFTGVDRFTYTASDGRGGTASAEAAITVGVVSLAGQWHTFGNGPAHTGHFPGTLVGGSLVPLWSATVGQTTFNPVAVADGRVYATPVSYFSGLYAVAFDADDGDELWRHNFVNGHSVNPPTYHNGRVYLQRGNHGGDTQLWALRAGDGGAVWSAPFSAQWENYFAPAVTDHSIWINGGYYGGMYGFRHDGTQIQFVNQGQYDEWTPSILGDFVYAQVAGSFSKYRLDGSHVWTHTRPWNWAGWSMGRTTALADGRAYLIGNPDLYTVNLADGTSGWTVPGNFSGSPAVAGRRVYAIQGSAVKAYDAATGTEVASYAADAPLTSEQPLVTDDGLLVSSANATYVFHLASGALLQKIDRGGQLALADGVLYIAGAGIHAYRLQGVAAAPSAPDLLASSDTGASDSDDVTADDTPTFSGTAAPGATVLLFGDGRPVGTATADAAGAWTVTASTLPPGTHRVAAAVDAGGGAARLSGELAVTVAGVAGRHVFYNNSAAGAAAAAVPAIDASKHALLPGGNATFDNVTSYSRGINGLVIDLAGVPAGATPSAEDFQFHTGGAGGWTLAGGATVSLARGAGAGGTDRVTITLPDGAARDTWLRVTVKATERTGLARPDVFYFGNLVGETGDSTAGGSLAVTPIDLVRTRRAIFSDAAIDSRYDFNRDGRVSVADYAIARSAVTGRRSLALLNAPAAPAPVVVPPPADLRERAAAEGEEEPNLLA